MLAQGRPRAPRGAQWRPGIRSDLIAHRSVPVRSAYRGPLLGRSSRRPVLGRWNRRVRSAWRGGARARSGRSSRRRPFGCVHERATVETPDDRRWRHRSDDRSVPEWHDGLRLGMGPWKRDEDERGGDGEHASHGVPRWIGWRILASRRRVSDSTLGRPAPPHGTLRVSSAARGPPRASVWSCRSRRATSWPSRSRPAPSVPWTCCQRRRRAPPSAPAGPA
jgi:hypothetical protein